MTRRVLMLAFHFPPIRGSSGLLRTLNFVRDLPALGWQPRVLTASPRAYASTSEELLGEIPDSVTVRRLPCLDAGRHFAVAGAYPDFLAKPDRWANWLPPLVVAGLFDLIAWKPDVIWSTYPIPTAVLGGGVLARISGRPWVVDLRDSMTEEAYPPDLRLRRMLRRIESFAVNSASAVVFTSPGARRMYAARYPHVPPDRWVHIPNGYDEEVFQAAERMPLGTARGADAPLILLHSGLLDPVDRNPMPFFRAVTALKRQGKAAPGKLRIVLRSTGHDSTYRDVISQLGINDIVELAPPLGYAAALREMLDADGLLVFQGGNCNHQTPAKLYEYFRAGRPLLGITDPRGDTATAIRAACLPDEHIAPIDDEAEIGRRLTRFVDSIGEGRAAVPNRELVRHWCRSEQSLALARLLDRLLASPEGSGTQAAKH